MAYQILKNLIIGSVMIILAMMAQKGAIGIFKRLDKLSEHMITDWFDYLNVDY